jgi:hypothetical protein
MITSCTSILLLAICTTVLGYNSYLESSQQSSSASFHQFVSYLEFKQTELDEMTYKDFLGHNTQAVKVSAEGIETDPEKVFKALQEAGSQNMQGNIIQITQTAQAQGDQQLFAQATQGQGIFGASSQPPSGSQFSDSGLQANTAQATVSKSSPETQESSQEVPKADQVPDKSSESSIPLSQSSISPEVGYDISTHCSLGCKWSSIGNGICDQSCMTEECSKDYGDCAVSITYNITEECGKGCDWSKLGDGNCDEDCKVDSCHFDYGDCEDVGNISEECGDGCDWNKLGDGLCDRECMLAACHFDYGDCQSEEEDLEEFCDEGCSWSMLGDGNCDIGCMKEKCEFDYGDCKEDSSVQESVAEETQDEGTIATTSETEKTISQKGTEITEVVANATASSGSTIGLVTATPQVIPNITEEPTNISEESVNCTEIAPTTTEESSNATEIAAMNEPELSTNTSEIAPSITNNTEIAQTDSEVYTNATQVSESTSPPSISEEFHNEPVISNGEAMSTTQAASNATASATTLIRDAKSDTALNSSASSEAISNAEVSAYSTELDVSNAVIPDYSPEVEARVSSEAMSDTLLLSGTGEAAASANTEASNTYNAELMSPPELKLEDTSAADANLSSEISSDISEKLDLSKYCAEGCEWSQLKDSNCDIACQVEDCYNDYDDCDSITPGIHITSSL